MAEQMETEGDSSQNSLANVQRIYKAFMKDTLQRTESERHTDKSNLAALKKERDRLTEELIKLQANKQIREGLDDVRQEQDAHTDDTVLRQGIKANEDELSSAKAHYYQDERCLQALQHRECVHKHLFPRTGPTQPNGEEMIGLLDTQLGLVKKILVHSREVQEARERLVSVREERMACVENCRQINERIESLHKEGRLETNTDNEDESQQSELDRVSSEVSLLTHSLQCLITGSNVDWASEDELLELTIKLGDKTQWI